MADLDRIRNKCSEDEADELDVLVTAVARTKAAYQDGYAEIDLKKWNAAKGALAEFAAGLEAKYFPAERTFPHRNAALAWLVEQGYKIKKSKFYADCNRGLCVIEGDNSVRESALLAYAAEHLKRIQDEEGNLTPLTEEKARLENEKLKIHNERARFEQDKERGKWVPKKDLALELAVRAGVLDSGARHLLLTRMGDWISMAGGNTKKVQTVLEVALSDWDILVNEYASMDTMHVLFVEEG